MLHQGRVPARGNIACTKKGIQPICTATLEQLPSPYFTACDAQWSCGLPCDAGSFVRPVTANVVRTVQEAMRMHPVGGGSVRNALQDTVIGGGKYIIPRGCEIFITVPSQPQHST